MIQVFSVFMCQNMSARKRTLAGPPHPQLKTEAAFLEDAFCGRPFCHKMHLLEKKLTSCTSRGCL